MTDDVGHTLYILVSVIQDMAIARGKNVYTVYTLYVTTLFTADIP